MTTTLQTVTAAVASVVGRPSTEVTPTSRLDEDLGADSLDIFQIAMLIEDELHIELMDSDLMAAKTVQALSDLVDRVKAPA